MHLARTTARARARALALALALVGGVAGCQLVSGLASLDVRTTEDDAPGTAASVPDGGTVREEPETRDRALDADAATGAPDVHVPPGAYALTVDVSGKGCSVVSDPPGIDCFVRGTRRCVSVFPAGTAVKLTASGEPSIVLESWSGACSPAFNRPECRVVMDSDKSAAANFLVD